MSVENTLDDILSSNFWKNTKSFKNIKEKETQLKYYTKMGACAEVLQLVALESKSFGTELEKIIQEVFKLGKRTSTQNDGTYNNKKIEIKSSRYWGGKDEAVWQHIEEDYDYDYIFLVLLDFTGIKTWVIKKSLLMGEVRDKKVIRYQGKQGWWVKKSNVVNYLTPIKSIEDFEKFIQ